MKKLLIAAGVTALLTACAGGMSGMSNTGSRTMGGGPLSNTGMSTNGAGTSLGDGRAMGGAMPMRGAMAPMSGGNTMAGPSVMVGGAAMLPSRDIVDNAVNSADHTTLVAAVKAAGLVDTLKSPGPFTVFAPTNAAFAALPAGTVDTLLQPANKPALTKVLTYHVVPGRLDAAALSQQIMAGGGRAMLRTASGGTLTATMAANGGIMVTDDKGGSAMVTIPNVYQSNGVIHVVNRVLLPS